MNERVQIVNPDHPHFPEHGTYTGEVIRFLSGELMANIDLDHCQHGMKACFVDAEDIVLVRTSISAAGHKVVRWTDADLSVFGKRTEDEP